MCQNWNFVINYFDTISVNKFFEKLNTNEIEKINWFFFCK